MSELYSKKTMQLFKHPKNIGEIKNADGIGKVGNLTCGDIMEVYIKVGKNKKGQEILKDIKVKTFGCLPPNEKVVVNSGEWKDISLIQADEKLINDLGQETGISRIFEIDYNGPMLKIIPLVSPFNSFYATPEHPILCVKRKWFKTREQEPHSKWLRILDSNFLSKKPEFVETKNLELGDYLVFSFNQKIEDSPFFTKEWMRLIGYYLAEGYITSNNGTVAFSFNKKEDVAIDEVKNLIFKIINKKCSLRIRKNVAEVYVCSRKLARLLNSFAGKFAKEKNLSKEIMLLPAEKQIELINTFYIGDGDATIRRKNNTPTYRLATASEDLAIQFQEILARNGIFSSIIKRPQKAHFIEKRQIKAGELFIVSFKKERTNKFVHKQENSYLVPIKKIEKIQHTGFVYNLDVDKEPHSYLVKGFAVHNCIAAIATSSVITEMAKGKTLEEALKITKMDIAKKIGGLPPIKMHCSVLSAQGLKEAIEDYYKKKK